MAYGENAREEALRSIETLRASNGELPVTVISDTPLQGVDYVYAPDEDAGARWAKLNVDLLSPYDHTLYLDADTRVYQDLSAGFQMLRDGFELVLTPSENQGEKWLWHVHPAEVRQTREELGYEALQLQGGVIYFRKCAAVHKLFSHWRTEWKRYKAQDQGALLRALAGESVRIWLLGRPWNGGAVVSHNFGAARRKAGRN